jgi:hypothetical protein
VSLDTQTPDPEAPLDLLFKGAGLYLAIRALLALPAALEALTVFLLNFRGYMGVLLGLSGISVGIKAVTARCLQQMDHPIAVLLYVLFAINLWRGGSWVRWILGGGRAEQAGA